MALQPIPDAWLKRVASVLRRGTSREIRRTAEFSQKFQLSFPNSSEASLIPAYLAFLEGPTPHGCPVKMDRPPGETWEFWFTFKNKQVYGKILLKTDRKHVILHSAHLPEKPYLRCEQT